MKVLSRFHFLFVDMILRLGEGNISNVWQFLNYKNYRIVYTLYRTRNCYYKILHTNQTLINQRVKNRERLKAVIKKGNIISNKHESENELFNTKCFSYLSCFSKYYKLISLKHISMLEIFVWENYQPNLLYSNILYIFQYCFRNCKICLILLLR